MPTVSVIEPLAAYRRGLEAALTEAGLTVAADDPDLVILSVGDTSCADLEEAADGRALVVALLTRPSARQTAHAARHGAAAIADRAAEPSDIARIAVDALEGRVALPAAVFRDLAAEWPDPHAAAPSVTEEEIEWLNALTRGVTVARLADDVGYSERAMFRRLHDLYARLGAANRSEAISAAGRLGLDRAGDR
jgi:DNA-binding NarL/FixJ family response regulator